MNTAANVTIATVCVCLDGFFRDVQTNEGPAVACTRMSDVFFSLYKNQVL